MKNRSKVFTVRFSPEEFGELSRRAAAVGMRPSQYLRTAAFEATVSFIPSINKEQWRALANISSNLNQLVRSVNTGRAEPGILAVVQQLLPVLKDVREGLVR